MSARRKTRNSPDAWSRPAIVAWAPGFGPAWPETLAKDVTEDKPLRLVRDDVPITGRVVDLEGRAVREASIRVHMVELTKTQLPGCEPAVSNTATTDRDGRFRLTGVGRDRLAILDIRGPSIAFRRVQVMTRQMNRLENPAPKDRRYSIAAPTAPTARSWSSRGSLSKASSATPRRRSRSQVQSSAPRVSPAQSGASTASSRPPPTPKAGTDWSASPKGMGTA